MIENTNLCVGKAPSHGGAGQSRDIPLPAEAELSPGRECERGKAGSAWRSQSPERGGLLQTFRGI